VIKKWFGWGKSCAGKIVNKRDVEPQLPVTVMAVQTCPDQGLLGNLQFCVSGSSAFWEFLILNFLLRSDAE